VHDGTGVAIALCEDALDVLEAAIFGVAAHSRGAALGTRSSQAAPYQQQGRTAPQYQPPAYSARKRKKLPIVLAVTAVLIVIGILVYLGAPSGTLGFSNGWRGFKDFDSFSRAADMDEFLGEKITEDQFAALLLIGSLFTDTMTMDIVSAEKLTQRYEVPRSLSGSYRYLIKGSGTGGSESYLAYSNGDRWYVVSVTGK
jgi:hypothetical protein